MSSDLVQKARLAAAVILSTDGDRDWSNGSNLLVEEALAAANELKQSADHIEQLEGENAALKTACKNTNDLLKKIEEMGSAAERRSCDLEARAERLRVALDFVDYHISKDNVEAKERIREALSEDDKQ
jgi:hypothetical protein